MKLYFIRCVVAIFFVGGLLSFSPTGGTFRSVKKKTAKKNLKKEKRKLKNQPWLYVSIVTLLLLIIISYVLIKKYLTS